MQGSAAGDGAEGDLWDDVAGLHCLRGDGFDVRGALAGTDGRDGGGGLDQGGGEGAAGSCGGEKESIENWSFKIGGLKFYEDDP